MQFSVSGSERQACVPLMRGNTVKSLSLGSPYWRGGIVDAQLWSINTLITGLREGHVSFSIRLSRRD